MKKLKIHFVGIKGVGMAPLAIICKQAGHIVTGSDVPDVFITDKPLLEEKIVPFESFARENVENADLVITTGAHGGFENIEVKAAKELGIKVWTHGQAVGEFMSGEILGRDFSGISIAGTHGKTTTTGIVATILKQAGLDPTYIIGTSDLASLGNSGHYGAGKYFVAEADEYATEPKHDKTPRFMWQKPKYAIFTNIEFDHPDLYNNVDEVRSAFLKFSENIKNDGVLVCNADDSEIAKIIKEYKGRVVTFGMSPNADFMISNISVTDSQTFFWVKSKGMDLGQFSVGLIGEHNAMNALAALALSFELGLSINDIKTGLSKFKGSKRRFEYVGQLKEGALLFDDYAHHPTEIRKTLEAFRQAYKKHKIVCVFQPHTYSRTKKLFDEFSKSFGYADEVIITDIYPSMREEPDSSVSSKLLATEIRRYKKEVNYLQNLKNVIEYIDQKPYDKNTVIISMGAGDIYKIKEGLM
ncbi:UDP-N-acetylmuramate--L-alanine ligase [Patescibacteria group bacterium]|nr:UDP-N-acetylmuramate--L-alanine ligase [Patescibacteria group bacterium]